MMDINKLNEWSSGVCGVTIGRYQYPNWFAGQGDTFIECDGEWTLEDPRCREIFREKFNITTDYVCPWMSYSQKAYRVPDKIGRGETIQEAELACAWAIYEAEHDKT